MARTKQIAHKSTRGIASRKKNLQPKLQERVLQLPVVLKRLIITNLEQLYFEKSEGTKIQKNF